MDFKTLSSLGRFKEIILTLVRYGFSDLVQRLALPGTASVEKITHVESELSTYERIRKVLEDLGPTFIKFGQIMSLRPDLLPQPLIKELRRLQDDVTVLPFSDMEKVIEESLGGPVRDFFRILDPEPVAAASLSQVYRGVLQEGGHLVAVKVQRPGIRRKMERDLDILKAVVVRLHERLEELRAYDLPDLLKLVREHLLRELDFRIEFRYMKIARSYAAEDGEIYIPEVYGDFSTRHLLVMEYVQGERLGELDRTQLAGAEDLAKRGLRTALKQILDDGFFHADPHPGNILITPGERLCLLDWGMVGRLTQSARNELIHLIHAVVERDTERVLDTLLTIAKTETSVDRRAIEMALLDIIDSHLAAPLREMRIGQLLLDITSLLREHRLRLPPDLGIVTKALITAEGSARIIYPDLNVVAEAEPYVKELALGQYKPSALWHTLHTKMTQILAFQGRVPRLLAQIADKVDQGKLSIRFEHENLEGFNRSFGNSFNRLTMGIIVAALIIGSSMIITTGVGPLLFGFPALGVIGYLISACIGLWLVISIIRTRRY